MATAQKQIPRLQAIESLILAIRGLRVMLDSDLAKVYRVTTGQLNQALKRNAGRFPQDFAFQLVREELRDLISQNVISKNGRGGRTKLPWVFTEHGALMLASVLNSSVAIEASVRVVRAFVLMREQLAVHKELSSKLAELEAHVSGHDGAIQDLFEAIRQLIEPAESSKREIGFHIRETATPYRVKTRKRF
jgi:hypothetical protein